MCVHICRDHRHHVLLKCLSVGVGGSCFSEIEGVMNEDVGHGLG